MLIKNSRIWLSKKARTMKCEFFMPMIPPTVTAQEHKVTMIKGKPVFYDPPELNMAKGKITGALYKAMPEDWETITGPCRLIVKWLFPVTGKHKDGEWKVTKPDTDNLQKMLKDCMTRLHYWKDDALVVSEVVEKFWAEIPGIYISIQTID